MADSAALLVDDILPYQPMRQWVLSVPFPLRFLFASNPKVMTRALGIIYRTIATHLALNLNIHFHMLFLDGVYAGGSNGLPMWFRQVEAPNRYELTRLTHTIAQRVGRYLERLCRYTTRPAVSTKRLSLTRNGQVRYELKTPWRNGTTHVIFEPLNRPDFTGDSITLRRWSYECIKTIFP
jgi:hypothetical protein